MKNKTRWNVLVFPGGTENGLEINKSLRGAKEVTLYSVSTKVKNHAEFLYKHHFEISSIYESNCLDQLNAIITKYKINYLFPANSLIIDFIVSNRHKLNCDVILPENNVVNLLRSKKKTYEFFKNKIKTPKVFNTIADVNNYPVFIKPDNMYGSQGVKKINSKEELQFLSPDFDNYVMSEYLPGNEYTVSCFSAKKYQLDYVMARSRERIRMGTSMRSEIGTLDIQKVAKNMAQTICKELGLVGLWFFQIKGDKNGVMTLLEVETRVAGTMAFSRINGVNLPLLSLYAKEQDVTVKPQKDYKVIIDRSLANRYKLNIKYQTVYVDLDDTIILKNKLNLELIKFLYQCVNKKIKIILLSKSLKKDKISYLEKWKIHQLFDEIYWLKEVEFKADYIKDENAIFIDDSFSQRVEVNTVKKIPTFDVSMIEGLLDDRSI